MGNFSGARKTCTSENSLQKLSKKPNKHKCLKTKNGTISISRHIYIKEQTEYIQNQIDKIRDSEDRQSRIAWQTINEVSRRKNTGQSKT